MNINGKIKIKITKLFVVLAGLKFHEFQFEYLHKQRGGGRMLSTTTNKSNSNM